MSKAGTKTAVNPIEHDKVTCSYENLPAEIENRVPDLDAIARLSAGEVHQQLCTSLLGAAVNYSTAKNLIADAKRRMQDGEEVGGCKIWTSYVDTYLRKPDESLPTVIRRLYRALDGEGVNQKHDGSKNRKEKQLTASDDQVKCEKSCVGVADRLNVTANPPKAKAAVVYEGTTEPVAELIANLTNAKPNVHKVKIGDLFLFEDKDAEYIYNGDGKFNRTNAKPQPKTDAYIFERNFQSVEESQALHDACLKLPFARRLSVPWGKPIRHQTVTFTSRPSARADYVGAHFPLSEAPEEIKALAAKLSAHVGKDINYLSCVLYENSEDYMNHHQHEEDRRYDASVYIVSTGCERPFAVREIATKETHTFIAEQGSLITLKSEANETHTHAVPKCVNAHTPRIAINCKSVGPRVYSCRKGDESPEGAVYVGREVRDRKTGKVRFADTPFGNHRRLPQDEFCAYAIEKIKDDTFRMQVEALRGKDLLCWCTGKEREHCHAKVWLELANRE
jgi:alkylated DNA repair dioxygenase AlkB